KNSVNRRGGGGSADNASPNMFFTSSALTLVSTGALLPVTRAASRSAARSTGPSGFATPAAPVVLVSESDSNTIKSCPGRLGLEMGFGPHAVAIETAAIHSHVLDRRPPVTPPAGR